MSFDLPRIYPITDTRISGLSHAEQVERLMAGGARFIQLREKHASPGDFYLSAVQAVEIAKKRGARVIINDRVDIALAAKADGVHLGQDDMPPASAREMLGRDAIIGFSTHSIDQAREALALPVDYIAIGPIFETLTKENADAIIGTDALRKTKEMLGKMPLVAIGGIDSKLLASVFDAGADSAAMIGAILSDPSQIEDKMRSLIGLANPIR